MPLKELEDKQKDLEGKQKILKEDKIKILKAYREACEKSFILRQDFYKNAISKIKTHIKSFLKAIDRSSLDEPVKRGELLFDTLTVFKNLDYCLSEDINNVEKLDVALKVLGMDVVNGTYEFKPSQPYTNGAQDFMLQMTYVFTALRFSFAIMVIYENLSASEHLNTQSYTYKQDPDNPFANLEVPETFTTEDKINQSLRAIRTKVDSLHSLYPLVNKYSDEFKNLYEESLQRLESLIKESEKNFYEGYKSFPNKSILSKRYNSPVQNLFIALANEVFDRQYSVFWGELALKGEFLKLLIQEITQACQYNLNELKVLKFALLKDEISFYCDLESQTREFAAEHYITLQPLHYEFKNVVNPWSDLRMLGLFRTPAAAALQPESPNQGYNS